MIGKSLGGSQQRSERNCSEGKNCRGGGGKKFLEGAWGVIMQSGQRGGEDEGQESLLYKERRWALLGRMVN